MTFKTKLRHVLYNDYILLIYIFFFNGLFGFVCFSFCLMFKKKKKKKKKKEIPLLILGFENVRVALTAHRKRTKMSLGKCVTCVYTPSFCGSSQRFATVSQHQVYQPSFSLSPAGQ